MLLALSSVHDDSTPPLSRCMRRHRDDARQQREQRDIHAIP
jgi:hypothetical protein